MLRTTLTVTALAILAFMTVANVHAAAVQNDTNIPVSGQVFNPCNGEVVDFNGYIHLLTTVTQDAAGSLHLDIHDNTQGITATGETTGAKYVGSETDNFTLNLTNGAQNETVNGQFRETGQGSVPNFMVTYLMHITVNANGTITAFIDNFNATCR